MIFLLNPEKECKIPTKLSANYIFKILHMEKQSQLAVTYGKPCKLLDKIHIKENLIPHFTHETHQLNYTFKQNEMNLEDGFYLK